MANPEHVEIVKQGAEAIAAWRKENPATVLDLSEANLREVKLYRANLSKVNLREANLREANLIRANLSDADLREAILRDAKLVRADLSGADLRKVNLIDADLREAILRGANLVKANLTEANLPQANLIDANLSEASLLLAYFGQANLRGAELSRACCGETAFTNLDLSTVTGLDSITHVEPSSIGVDTIFMSGGKIPTAFLRGCGVPDTLIEYLASLLGSMNPVDETRI